MIQRVSVPTVESYKYLRTELSAAEDYLIAYREQLSEIADRVIKRLNARTLRSFNRFETSKILWRATAVS